MADFLRELNRLTRVPGVSSMMVMMTSTMAEMLLALNTHNRKISKAIVSKYAAEILAGEWRASAAGVGISDSGVLIDGQHRLAAVVQSGQTVPMLVVWNLPLGSQEKMDRHFRRSILQVLNLAGIDATAKQVQVATLMARGNKLGFDRNIQGRVSSIVSDAEIKASLSSHGQACAEVCKLVAGGNKRGWSAGVLAALTTAYEMYQRETIDFIAKSRNLAGLTRDDPAFKFFMWINDPNNKLGGGADRQRDDYQRTAFCFNAHLRGEKIQALRTADRIERLELAPV